MPNFYSQHGEDALAYHVLGASKGPRYFVEIGMIDGRRYSNTLAFEERGWQGLCVEAHPKYADLVRINRPGSTVIHAAAGDRSGVELPFYADERGDLSGLAQRDESEMKQRFGKWFTGFSVVKVPVRTLDEMLQEVDAPRGMELVSIDIEGTELDVLRGFNLDYWQPRVLIIEGNDAPARAALTEHLAGRGYRYARRHVVNMFYARSRLDVLRLRMALADQPLVHTQHPIDPPGSERVIPAPVEQPSRATRVMDWLRAA